MGFHHTTRAVSILVALHRYDARFPMPSKGSKSSSNHWWSYDAGPAHVISLNSCVALPKKDAPALVRYPRRTSMHGVQACSDGRAPGTAASLGVIPIYDVRMRVHAHAHSCASCRYDSTVEGGEQYNWLVKDLDAIDRGARLRPNPCVSKTGEQVAPAALLCLSILTAVFFWQTRSHALADRDVPRPGAPHTKIDCTCWLCHTRAHES